jgi:hypothetical protein
VPGKDVGIEIHQYRIQLRGGGVKFLRGDVRHGFFVQEVITGCDAGKEYCHQNDVE